MHKLGLDFGTTNSILSYCETDHKVVSYRMGGAQASEYIPSCVAIDRDDGSLCVGRAARAKQGDKDYDVFCGFKMLLGEKNEERLTEYGYISKKPKEITRLYFQHLLQKYREEQNLREQIENIVITVPEIWIKEGRHLARECLREVSQELELPLKRFISEPVAASAYFSHCFREREKSWFSGHVLVCDYGGGTLDLTLSRIDGERITVLECTGKGHDERTIGRAGVAFDETVVIRVYEKIRGEKLSRSDPRFYKLMQQFEEQKIAQKEEVDKRLEQYLKRKTVNRKLFEIDSMEFYPPELCEAFDEVIRPDFIHALSEMKAFLEKNDIDCNDGDHFRVVMVGGFSSFYLVQRTVREFFGSQASGDRRFESHFSLQDTALAISKGAALVAGDIVEIDPSCPISVGLRVLSDANESGVLRETDIPVLQKGVKISEYREPQFVRGGIRLQVDPTRRKIPIKIFLGDEERRCCIELDKAVDQLFPNVHEEGNQWRVGFSVNEDCIFTLHVEDAKGVRKETTLGDLQEKVSGLIWVGEKR